MDRAASPLIRRAGSRPRITSAGVLRRRRVQHPVQQRGANVREPPWTMSAMATPRCPARTLPGPYGTPLYGGERDSVTWGQGSPDETLSAESEPVGQTDRSHRPACLLACRSPTKGLPLQGRARPASRSRGRAPEERASESTRRARSGLGSRLLRAAGLDPHWLSRHLRGADLPRMVPEVKPQVSAERERGVSGERDPALDLCPRCDERRGSAPPGCS
jgi:hypothetical protein